MIAAGLLAALLAVAVFLAPGCGKTTTGTGSDRPGSAEKKADPWEVFGKRIHKETDVAACKSALAQLAGDLPNRTDVDRPGPVSPEAEKAITDLVPLDPPDLQEVRQSGFTPLDAVYLAECIYLRDAARSIESAAPGLTAANLANLGFAWVCREVYLNPWLVPAPRGAGLMATALPPEYVLRRGYGSGLERAYVFLALLQQLGIDGCLVGPPTAADKYAGFVAMGPDNKPLTGTPKGPFWAVGARLGGDVLLFEPWRGQPFPGTLAQLKANQEPLKPWLDDKGWGVTADDVKKATVFLAVPVNALAPRMELLEQKLRAETGSRLAVNPAKLRDRFTAAAPNGPGVAPADVRFWNPAGDRFAYGRALASFLPLEEGGTDRDPAGNRLFDQYAVEQVPRSVFSLPSDIPLKEAAPRKQLINAAISAYAHAFLEPPLQQERIQRGQFQDAIRALVEREDQFKRGQERLRSEKEATAVRDWCRTADELSARLSRAESFNPDDLPAARAEMDKFWKSSAPVAQLIVDRVSADVGLSQASYLYALGMQEMAERKQVRAERASPATAKVAKAEAEGAWKAADHAWEVYKDRAGPPAWFPGRAEHTRALAERARNQLPQKK